MQDIFWVWATSGVWCICLSLYHKSSIKPHPLPNKSSPFQRKKVIKAPPPFQGKKVIKSPLSFKPPLPSTPPLFLNDRLYLLIMYCNTWHELAQYDLLMCLKWRGTETTCRVKGQRWCRLLRVSQQHSTPVQKKKKNALFVWVSMYLARKG